MISNMYWITALIFAIVLYIIIVDEKNQKGKRTKSDKAFNEMVIYAMLFCLQDVVWGLCDCDIIKGDTALFISSSFFHLAIVFTSFFCLKFFLSYLGRYVKYKNIYIGISITVIIVQVCLVTINLFHPILFRIEDGKYITEILRPLSFLDQYIVYLIIGGVTFVCVKRADTKHKAKFRAIFWVAITPIFIGIFQLHYPEAPFYSLGYFLECFIVHFFITSKDRNESSRSAILNAIESTYYTMHLFNLVRGTMEDYIESEVVAKLIEDRKDAQGSISRVMSATVKEEYLDSVMEFVDLSTLPQRLENQNIESLDFVGKIHGWTRASFIPIERDDNGKLISVMFTTQIIDEQKKKEQEMFANSTIDQLTSLYNRRAYEMDIDIMSENNKNMIYISIDVNGLKVVNDSLGHAAGDELLQGAAWCMKKCFGPYGKVYRTGGDEFAVIIFATQPELEHIKEDFEETILDWKGEHVDSVAVSCGYVMRKEDTSLSLSDIAKLADKRMYKDKAAFYARKGVDRRGQSEAHKVLYSLYTKILKINLTTDSFTIVNMYDDEQTVDMGYSESISEWLKGFGESGCVHPEDMEEYFRKTDPAYMGEYFERSKTSLIVQYRRKYDSGFKLVMMEIIPASDYTSENQSLFLYVKNIDM